MHAFIDADKCFEPERCMAKGTGSNPCWLRLEARWHSEVLFGAILATAWAHVQVAHGGVLSGDSTATHKCCVRSTKSAHVGRSFGSRVLEESILLDTIISCPYRLEQDWDLSVQDKRRLYLLIADILGDEGKDAESQKVGAASECLVCKLRSSR